MYRLILKTKAFGKFDDETKRFERYDADRAFDCETKQQLTGLLEFLIETSTDALDLTISRMEENDD